MLCYIDMIGSHKFHTQWNADNGISLVWRQAIICNNSGVLLITARLIEQQVAFISLVIPSTVKPVCNDHLYDKMYNLWLIQ